MQIAKIITGAEWFLGELINVFVLLLQYFGAAIIMYGAVMIFIKFFQLRYEDPSTRIRIKLERTIALGLEFYLAAEIFETVFVKEIKELYVIGAIIVLRVIMALVIHWEMERDLKHLIDEEKV